MLNYGRIKVACLAAATVFLFSCAGEPVKIDPPHMTSGTEQIALGNSAYKHGCNAAALKSYYRAYELYSASDQPAGVAMSLNNMGNVYRALGKPADALKYFAEASILYARSGDRQGQRQVLANKAAALVDLGRLEQAEAALTQAEKIELPDAAGFLPLIVNRGVLLTRRGDFPAAERTLETALAKSRAGGTDAAAAHYAMGRLKMDMGQFKPASDHLQAALKADQAAGFYAGMADDLQRLGDAHSRLNEPDAALDYWKRSVRIYALIGNDQETGAVMNKLRTEAARTGASLEVVEAFVKNCREGKSRDRLCR